MTGGHSATGAVSAWRFLKRNPRYILEWWVAASGIPPPGGEPFPIRRQSEADLEAAPWGLLAWEDPLAEGGPASPFWSDAPMAAGMPGRPGTPSFAALMRERGAHLSGLLLRDGALILRIERGAAAGQVRIEDGAGFDPAGGLALSLSWGLDHLSVELARAGDLRAVVVDAGEGSDNRPGPSRGRSRASSCSPSTASFRTSRPA